MTSVICYMAVRQERQVIAQHIDRYRREHKKQGDPDAPIVMRAFPVGTRVLIGTVMNTAWIRPFVPVVTKVGLIHFCSAFHFQPSRCGGRNLRSPAPSILRLGLNLVATNN